MKKKLRSDFPILNKKINGKPLIYLDNAATTQKPQQVIDAITKFYTEQNAPVRRGIYELAEQATQLFEDARATIAKYIGAYPNETIITKGTTEGINFVADAWALEHVRAGDEILVSELEHHSNFLPWQRLAERTGAALRVVPITEQGDLDYAAFGNMFSSKTKLVAITHVSNVLGTTLDIKYIIDAAHAVGAKVLVDAAQSVPHQQINVHELGCDFLVFSGHKMLGPTGVGVLYISKAIQNEVAPYQLGGGMVFEVDSDRSTWLESPYKFEAGTPPIAQAIGLAAAINYINEYINIQKLQQHEALLCSYLIDELKILPHVRILGPIDQIKRKGHLVSFSVEHIHGHDIAAFLATKGICVRAGHHCAQILHTRLQINASVRVSFYVYNTQEEVEILIQALKQLLS